MPLYNILAKKYKSVKYFFSAKTICFVGLSIKKIPRRNFQNFSKNFSFSS